MRSDQWVIRELPNAAARGEIAAFFQSQVDAATGDTVALEALSRWIHPERGVIPPQEFIPVVEESPSMDVLGDAMLRAACTYGAELVAAGRRIEIAVNVAAVQLAQVGFADRVERRLLESGQLPELLTLELTEARPSPPSASAELHRLRSLGLGISLDDVRTVDEADFRAGGLPITEIKVDRSIIERLPEDDEAAVELVACARRHGVRSVAEGVETERQWDAVRRLGFDRAQGFLFGRPMPPEQVTERLDAEAAGPGQSEL
ncbi:EAL domain-containing protein [Agromyces sp. GXS1127]|uniref:EAL domain-containing protein n=1 Tax=Agromyces sp. GXS1127 TaxID=3424181 RepID=UPI003D317BE4